MAAMMLMKSHCTDDPESEMRSINELLALLDPVTDYSASELTELQERRSLFEKKKNALLIALLSGDAEQEKEKMAELAAAGRLLRDAVSGKYQLHGQRRDVPIKLEEDVADIKRHLMKMMEGQGKSVLEESGAADSRAILERVLADNRIMLEMLHTLKASVADNKAMLESLGKKQNELKESFDNLDGSVDRLDDSVREGMEEMKESIESVDESVKEVKESMGSVEEYVKDVKETVESVEESVNDMKETIDGIEEMKESIESVDESVKEVKESMGSLEESVKDVQESMESVEESVNDMKDTIENVEKSVDKLEETVSDSLDQRA